MPFRSGKTDKKIRVLIVQDADDRAAEIAWQLKRGGFEPECESAATREAVEGALASDGPPDLVVADLACAGFPAIDLLQSGTRKEEKLFPAEMLERINLLRRSLLQVRKADEAMESLIKQLGKAKTNADFLDMVGKFVK